MKLERWTSPAGLGRALGYQGLLDFRTASFPSDWPNVWGCNFLISHQAFAAVEAFYPDGIPQDLLRLRGDGKSRVTRAINPGVDKTWFDSKASVHQLAS